MSNINDKTGRHIWLIAGESSGDLYGARIAEELRKVDPDVKVSGMGGVKMKEAGVNILVDSSELGVIGIVEVLENIFKFIKIMLFLTREAIKQKPDAVILIDYPGFNIRFAKRMWKAGIPVIWYISPQVWVWRKSNIPKYVKYCKKMIVIFPFEEEFWAGTGMDASFAGHPLIDLVKERTDASIIRDPKQVVLLPGSRKSETSRLLYPFMETAAILKQRHPDWNFAISAPRQRTRDDIEKMLASFKKVNPALNWPEVELSCGKTAYWMQRASAGLAASGTVTVESAIANLPLTVAYRLNPITFLLARLIIRKLFRGFFTMPDIILNRCVFEEFLQFQVVPEVLADSVEKIMPGGTRYDEVQQGMEDLRNALSLGHVNAAANAARIICETVDKNR